MSYGNNSTEPEKFYQNPDPSKKNMYRTLSKLPFFMLIFIVLFIYINLNITYLLPLIFDKYDLESYELHMKQAHQSIQDIALLQLIQVGTIQNYNQKIIQFVKQQTDVLTESQIYGLQLFVWFHIIGAFFIWALVKTMKTSPGEIPKNYKENELKQYFQQEEEFVKQLLDQLRQRQRATIQKYQNQIQIEQNQQQQQYQSSDKDIFSEQDEEIQDDNITPRQTYSNPHQIEQQQQLDQDQDQDNQNNMFDDSDIQIHQNNNYQQNNGNNNLAQQDQDDLDMGSYDYEEEQEIIWKLKLMHQENIFKKANERFCKKCQKFKPDRAHHCSQCRKCVLKMDHHCQWVDNCLGFYNYKYFIVMLFFATLALIVATYSYITCYLDSTITIGVSVFRLFNIALMFYFTLIVTIIVFIFSCFHFWLIINNKTTIEWCERKKDSLTGKYDVGCFENIKQNLNSNPLLWFLPLSPNLEGQGLEFKVKEGYEY